jgi:hypothetical protein
MLLDRRPAAFRHALAPAAERPATARHWLMALIGAAGLAAAICGLFLAAGAVLAVGGSCADGGPYIVETACPDGVATWAALSVPSLWVFGPLLAFGGARIAPGSGWLPLLGWPVLFGSLAWRFFAAAADASSGAGGRTGYLFCGVVFVALALPGVWLVKPLRALAGRAPVLVLALVAGIAGGVAFALAFGP